MTLQESPATNMTWSGRDQTQQRGDAGEAVRAGRWGRTTDFVDSRSEEQRMDVSHVARNDAARDRLRDLVERLSDDDLARSLTEGWTVGAALAHVAFWDRFALAHWRRHLDQGEPIVSLPEHLEDLINAAGLEQWLAMPPHEAARQALAAAEELDRTIQDLPPEAVAAVRAGGFRRMLDRFAHRREHLDEIERALRPEGLVNR